MTAVRHSRRWLSVLLTIACLPLEALGYEKAFSPTGTDGVEVRTLPAGRWLVTESAGGYFEQSDGLFRRLFDYIRANDVAMTVPVEGSLGSAQMRFYLGTDVPTGLASTDTVRTEAVPSRRVASLAGSGAYGERNVGNVRARLETWLSAQDRWVAAGEPYAVFWNGPFTPWFLKRFEVHVPVARFDTSYPDGDGNSAGMSLP